MKTFAYKARVWRYQAETAAWFFLTLDTTISNDIKLLVPKKRGWGQIKVEVTIGHTTWQTCLFPSKKEFFLPVKASVRKKEGIQEGDMVTCSFVPIM